MNLHDFIADSRQKGMAKGNRFTVYFNAPTALTSFSVGQVRTIALYCSSATLPGVSLSTQGIRTTGEVREMPYDRNFQDFHVTFYADATMAAKYFFDEWINCVQDRETRLFNYFDDYSIPVMQVDMEDVNGNVVYSVEMYDVYPKSVEAVSLAHGNNNIVEIGVNFVYRYWQSNLYMGGQLVQKQPALGASVDPFITIPGAIGGLLGGAGSAMGLDSLSSVFSSGLNSITSSIGGLSSGIGNLPNLIPSNMFNVGNANLIKSMTSSLNVTTSILSNINVQLSSQAGLQISASTMANIGSQIGSIKTMVTSSSPLGSSISLFTPSSVGSITTQLTSMNGHVGNLSSAVGNVQATVNAGISAATGGLFKF